jgi:hypothetical protein
MSITLITTAGASNANAYTTVEETSTYFEARPDSSWNTETNEEVRKAALIRAAQTFDILPWMGKKMNDWPEGHTSYQSLAWPRIGTNRSESWGGLMPYCYDSQLRVIVPVVIKRASMEQANFMLSSGGLGDIADRVRLQSQGVTSFTIPGLSEQYSGRPKSLANYSTEALALLRGLLVENNRLFRA